MRLMPTTIAELCVVADMAKVVFTEPQFSLLRDDDVTTMRVTVSAAAKLAAAAKGDDLLAGAEMPPTLERHSLH
eukprot:9503188-Pyramimonas_sp.AAC.1